MKLHPIPLTKTHMTHDIESVMEHFEYIANLVGIEHASFGIDSLYGDHVDCTMFTLQIYLRKRPAILM